MKTTVESLKMMQGIIDIVKQDTSLSFRFRSTYDPVQCKHNYLSIMINNDQVGAVCTRCEYAYLDHDIVRNKELSNAISQVKALFK